MSERMSTEKIIELANKLRAEHAAELEDDDPEIPQSDKSPFTENNKRPCFVVLEKWVRFGEKKSRPGVYYCGMTQAKRDAEPTSFEKWVCSPLQLVAVTFDGQQNNYGRLLRFPNTLGRWRQWAMPMELLRGSGEELRGELLAMGVTIDPKDRALLAQYLQSTTPKRRIHCALQVGWCGKLFVLPDTVIGPDAADVIFQSGERGHEEFTVGGTLEGWREGIAALAINNTVLALALSAGFAGPLLTRCNGESGGIHYVNENSTGKSTAVEAGCSIWGGPNFKRSWRATANDMEGAAAMCNDSLLALDEIGECDPREVGAIIYSLANGLGKQRANRTGAARSVTRWRCMVLSSGERTIETHMAEAGQCRKGGQAVRLLDVPVARTHGAWDELHGFPSGAAFSDALKAAATTHYGHAGRAFLERLTRDERNFCALLDGIKATRDFAVEGAEGQHKRVAARFALIGLAGELATGYGITGWQEGEALKAAAEGFRLWQSQHGKGNDEHRQILEQVAAFIDRHGDGRFSSMDACLEKYPIRDRAGWWRDSDEGREYLFTPGGMREALNGFDFKRGLDVLQEEGALPEPGGDGKRARFQRINGRGCKVYPINAEKLDGGDRVGYHRYQGCGPINTGFPADTPRNPTRYQGYQP